MTDEVIAGRYRLLEPLGRGSMSSVWRAHDDELDRDVAIKTLAPTADRARFQREARAVAALAHPNICNVYDYGDADGKPYMVLECLAGGTLEDRLKDGKPLDDAATLRYANEIAAGLAHAHAHGVVHRDLKPANVLFDSEGRAKIADFGIASVGDAGTLTEAGTVLGTAAYISPEQASGLAATAASDVYSFGVILFRMLTGRLPFTAANAMELVRMNRDDPPPAVRDVRADAPAHLAWTADATLAKDPAARPADGAALLAALRDDDTAAATMVLPAAAAAAAAAGGGTRAARPTRSRSLLPALLVLALVLLGGGVALALALTNTGGGSTGLDGGTAPSISLPSVPTLTTGKTTTRIASTPSTTAPTTSSSTIATTTRQTTTAHTTTAHTTTAHTTTAHTTTAAPPPPTTYTVPTTTYDTTTYDTTTTDTFTDTTTTTGP